jgi:hypothetical protein
MKPLGTKDNPRVRQVPRPHRPVILNSVAIGLGNAKARGNKIDA